MTETEPTKPVFRNVAPDPNRFRKLKADLRDTLFRIHREMSDGIWTEMDDAVLDAVTSWMVDVADRSGTAGVPDTTRKVGMR
jgi:hypothetical protein